MRFIREEPPEVNMKLIDLVKNMQEAIWNWIIKEEYLKKEYEIDGSCEEHPRRSMRLIDKMNLDEKY